MWENGVYDYKKLLLEGLEERYDYEVGVSYCYYFGMRIMVSYDIVFLVRRKV